MIEVRSQTPISVIVPAYNAERYLDDCIASILGQSYDNMELVLVDDGSTDQTPNACDIWASRDPRVKVVHKPNAGLPAARNTGVLASRGEWVLFVDSDDMLEKSAIERLMAGHQDSDIVSFGWRLVDDSGKVLQECTPCTAALGTSDGLIAEIALGKLGDYIWSYMFRRKRLLRHSCSKGPFAEGYTLFEDAISLQRILRNDSYKVSYVPDHLYLYRQTPSSMSRRCNPVIAKSGLMAVRELEDMAVGDNLKGAWAAKLMLMLMLGVDQVAGPGFGDGQRALHREVEKEMKKLAVAGGFAALEGKNRMKYLLFQTHLYRPLKRAFHAFRRY